MCLRSYHFMSCCCLVRQRKHSPTLFPFRENEEASEVIRPLLSSSAPTVLTESPEQRKEIRANDIETGLKSHLTKKRFRQRSQALVSGLSYCLASCSMILLNKLVLSSYKWEAQICLMLYQVILFSSGSFSPPSLSLCDLPHLFSEFCISGSSSSPCKT